jgi:hydantoinase/carbamoylase family amidase
VNGVELNISAARIGSRIAQLAEFGGLPNGGLNRMPFTPQDREARSLFTNWLTGLGLSVRIDGAGNIIGRREGTDQTAPVVMTGSHLDSQPTGGRFDGIAGVVASLEVLETMGEAGFVHRHPIEIVCWTAEEVSCRFSQTAIGSRAMVGTLRANDLQQRCRLTGITLGEALTSIGVDLSALAAAERAPGSIKAVVELHVEQGPYLEQMGKQIGVVTQVQGATRVKCALRGQQAHSGGMPMSYRRDALCGAAELLLAVEAAAAARTNPPVVGTVGVLSLGHQAVAIVPGIAEMLIDVRSVDAPARMAVVEEIESAARRIAERRQLKLDWQHAWSFPSTDLAPEVIDTVEQACDGLGVSSQRMPSGAGHDAMVMGSRFPAGMIFVPSVRGISHAPEEFTRTEDIAVGAKVLCRTLCMLAR